MNARDMHAEMARWTENVTEPDLAAELSRMKEAVETGDESAFTDAFFRDLSFGTAGLRGTLGVDDDHFFIAMTAFTPYHHSVTLKTRDV